MTTNDMQSAWNSPRNDLPIEAQRQLAQKFSRQMIRRRRLKAIWLGNVFLWLTVITVPAIRTIAAGKVGLTQQWALLPLLVPWGFAFHFLRRHLKPAIPATRGELSVADSFRAALSANRTERAHLKLVAWLFAIMIPLLAVNMQQLYAVD